MLSKRQERIMENSKMEIFSPTKIMK